MKPSFPRNPHIVSIIRASHIIPKLLGLFAAALLVCHMGSAISHAAESPNVILIMTDDQGYGELSSHGHAILKTPNLDRLRDESVRLTDFHVSSKCSPTRGALMTGRHCRHVGVREADNGLIESYSGVVRTEEWRLVNNEELHNIQTDPAQERNVANEYPELVSKFRKALDKNRADDFSVIPRIIIGSEFQPEQEFTIYHWYDHHGYYNNLKVTQGELINGVIPIEVTKSGKFEFTLRRWPSDLELPISSKPDNNLDGFKLFNASDPDHRFKAIDIRSARLRVGSFDESSPVSETMLSVVFSLDLEAGETEIETWFTTADGKMLGAYYLDVRRIN